MALARPTRARALRIIGGVVALASVIAPAALASRLIEEHGPTVELRLTALVEEKDPARFNALLRRAVLAHPSEPMLAIIGAHSALRHDHAGAGRFINRGMQLAPGWSAPHVQAAQWLWNRGLRRQAMIELRAAAEIELWHVDPILCSMVQRDPLGAIEIGAPRNHVRARYLELVAGCLPRGSEHIARIDQELLRIAPNAPEPHLRQAHRLLREQRFDEAAKAAETARSLAPNNAMAAMLGAQALSSAGKPDEAYKVLQRALDAGVSPTAIYTQMARVATTAKDAKRMREALALLRGWVGTDVVELDRAYRHEAMLERELGNLGASLSAYEEAYRVANSPEALQGVAQTAEQLGDLRRALRAYSDLCALGPDGSEGCKHRDRLKNPAVKP